MKRPANGITIDAGVHPASEAMNRVIPYLRARRIAFKNKTVLDIGTGSGILAIHAARQGASRVVATDIDPKALACAERNARACGTQAALDLRLVSQKCQGAFSAVAPEETFDVILSNPPYQVSNVVHQPGRAEPMALALSIVDGLKLHLNESGVAVLHYGSAYLNEFLTRYARHRGYAVARAPTSALLANEWACLYNLYTLHVASKEKIDPRGVLWPGPWKGGKEIPPPSKGDYSGMILIRRARS